MLSSEKRYHITISFNQNIDGIMLTLVDGTLETIYTGIEKQLSVEIPEGIYKLKANFIDYSQEYPLIIDENKDFKLDFDYPSVAPILSFKTTHEYLHGNSDHFSQVSTNPAVIDKPNFLFFAAKYDKDEFPSVVMENLLSVYSIINSENETLYQFNRENARFNNEFGWLAFSTKFKSGLYFLQWKTELENRVFPFYIFDNYQTQFFIRYSQTADFDNCFFFYTKKMRFSVDAEEYLVLDKIIFAYKDYSNFKSLTEKDRYIIQQHPYLVTLVHVLQKELSKKLEFESSELLPLPDLSFICGELPKADPGEQLPIISFVMTKFISNSDKTQLTFKPASLIDRTIDNIRFDLFWNNFSKIDNTDDWLELYTNLVKKSALLPISKRDNQVVRLSKKVVNTFGKASKDTLNERLKALIGQIQPEKFENKVNDTLNSIEDVSEIADKLNLPPTKVLRNYKTFKSIYDKLK